MDKKERLAMIARVATRFKVQDMNEQTKITPKLHDPDPVVIVPKKPGRKPKNIIQEVINNADDFDYGKLSDDAGILPVRPDDLAEELSLMGTKIY